MSDQPNMNEPTNWLIAVLMGVLGAAGKWLWDRVMRAPRPPKRGHTSAYHAQQLEQILEKLDRVEAKVDDHGDRIIRLEIRRSISGD